MAKREKCEHGGSPYRISGCYQCVVRAMHSDRLLCSLGITPRELHALLQSVFPDNETWKAAREKARAKVNAEIEAENAATDANATIAGVRKEIAP